MVWTGGVAGPTASRERCPATLTDVRSGGRVWTNGKTRSSVAERHFSAGWPGRTLPQALPSLVAEVSRGGRGRTNGMPREALPSVTCSSTGRQGDTD